jgi:protein-disulfide isomerase
LAHQNALKPADLVGYAGDLGLDVERFHDGLKRHIHQAWVAQDVESADVSGATGTPTFFINGQRHYGAYDLDSLKAAIATARARLHAAHPQDAAPDTGTGGS